ncbi:SDR family oxidoreductase [Sulfurimonas sediminis]|uniref:SDR family oxidoreductase n=1 Tax=Sulfurimonas sediminis TaxID=2590020 RepID=A0A7M1B3F1_9BACT|nr:NAD-dependent epimerase/dehydratase family protein [Sulfurimonas sediminis]QOP43238.1 SDR family oxidoreductase [Sulfurimonas sediminis]
MKVLVTGSNGFIAKNLIEHLKRDDNIMLYCYSKKDSMDILEAYAKEADFIFHLAGVNRPENISEFYEGNSNLTKKIVDVLLKSGKSTPILFSSSTQATLDNDYGKSKLEAEELLLDYSKKSGANVYIYRLPNIFGKWARPNYNSVVATWCYNITHDLPLHVNNPSTQLSLVYVDDVVQSFLNTLHNGNKKQYIEIDTLYVKSLGEIEELLCQFKKSREDLTIPHVGVGFERALYATYLSYLPLEKFSYTLKGHQDKRGAFYEILKTLDSGQFSLSTTAPGVTRGNHYHHTKNEKFLVVRGEALIEFRHIVTNEIVSYQVSDKKMEIVEMIPGYTHNITNTGDEEMVLLLWANEAFDQDNPDTYFLEV